MSRCDIIDKYSNYNYFKELFINDIILLGTNKAFISLMVLGTQ